MPQCTFLPLRVKPATVLALGNVLRCDEMPAKELGPQCKIQHQLEEVGRHGQGPVLLEEGNLQDILLPLREIFQELESIF